MQLYEAHRSNTFVFFTKSANDDHVYRNIQGKSNQNRARQKTIDDHVNCDWRVSIALGKFSADLATNVGRTNREPVTDAVSGKTLELHLAVANTPQELYVITNKDVRALRALDLWLESVDTLEVLPNFPDKTLSKSVPNIANVDWDRHSSFIGEVVRHKKYDLVLDATKSQIEQLLQIGWKYDLVDLISEVYRRLLQSEEADGSRTLCCTPEILRSLVDFLYFSPAMAIHFARLCPWCLLPATYSVLLRQEVLVILRALVLCANRMEELVLRHLRAVLQEDIVLTLRMVQDLLETASLATKNPDLLLSILMECRDALLHAVGDQSLDTVAYFLRNMFGVALDHCTEVCENHASKSASWMLTPLTGSGGKVAIVISQRRIDAPKPSRLAIGDHVRFVAKGESPNSCALQAATFDAVVQASSDNEFRFKCLCQPPPWLAHVAFKIKGCVPFVTSKTMGEALLALLTEKHKCCGLAQTLLEPATIRMDATTTDTIVRDQGTGLVEGLNESQSLAVVVSTSTPLTCLWGPPGTGKTKTIVAILGELLKQDGKARILVAAPTHNAVDNVLRQFIKGALSKDRNLAEPIRVSTEVSIPIRILVLADDAVLSSRRFRTI